MKGRLVRGRPIPSQVLFGEVDQGAGNIGVVGDESLIEVGKAKE